MKFREDPDDYITIPDHCTLCGTLTQYGPPIEVDGENPLVCYECVFWAERDGIDIVEQLRLELEGR